MQATTINVVIDQLNEIVVKATANEDRAGYFAVLYRKVTIAVAEKIKEGYFDDNARMEKLDVIFANRYLQAYQLYQQGKPCSTCWQLAFDTNKLWKPMVMHHLLAGMNAHISLDLRIAAATVCPGSSINDIQNDFNKINAILIGLVDDVKLCLYKMWPLSKLLAKLNTDKLENDIAGFSMLVARDAAWQQAITYAPLTDDAARIAFISERDKAVTEFGKRFLYPGAWVQTVMSVFRLFEFGTVGSKIKALNEIKA